MVITLLLETFGLLLITQPLTTPRGGDAEPGGDDVEHGGDNVDDF